MSPLASERAREGDSDEDLLRKIADGERAAMQTLFARHQVRVFRFVFQMVRDEALAEDITSDTFLDIWRQADRFQFRSRVTTWILGIARFKALAARRKRREDSAEEEEIASVADSADTPELSAQKASKAGQLTACIGRLSEVHREIVDLVYYQELSIKEIAALLGIPDNTVKTRMFHARKRLSELMAEAGIDRGWP
ncbi:sigma-70 family RNA polymerase sigma factor [Afifella pfennigii]|uniref:sigma-70 family RNA polymerase sigma factor n=1 Tax=Afifella pfennigii TaxID=209897 RepID=UPI0004787221|nr:sigma-70 family RNA polymerase sigma factor [Afifella pfennigii]